MSPFHVAIDGPVSAGKGTISRLVAEKLGFLYVDTGAMYRMVVLLAQQNGVDVNDEAGLVSLIQQSKMEMHNPSSAELDGRLITVMLNGEDVSWKIRTQEVSGLVSSVARLAEVRKILVHKQQEIAQGQDVVMEGRDITYRVLPDAALKIYLTADETARAKRRHLQLEMRGELVSLEEVLQQIKERDRIDTSRAADPLKIIPEAWVVDTTDLDIDAVVNLIVDKVKFLQTHAT
jgi:cytidylate kinase